MPHIWSERLSTSQELKSNKHNFRHGSNFKDFASAKKKLRNNEQYPDIEGNINYKKYPITLNTPNTNLCNKFHVQTSAAN